MTKDVLEDDTLAREIFAKAREYTRMDIPQLGFDGTEKDLEKTENAQPAIFVSSYGICSVLRQKGEQLS